MAAKPIIRGPDLDSAKRDADTGRHLDVPRTQGFKRLPGGRMSSIIRRATGARKLT